MATAGRLSPFMHIAHLMLALTPLLGAATAQTVLLPTGFATTEGNGNATAPFGRGNQGARVQYIYDSAALVAAGMTAPVYLRTISWRANGGSSGQGGTFAPGSVTLKLGTCASDHLAVSGTFDANFATSQAWQLGSVAVTSAASTSPNSFTATVTVPEDFVYDPTAGQDLVIEVRIPSGAFTGQSGNNQSPPHDVHMAPGIGASRLVSNNPNTATVAPDLDSAGVLQLGYAPLPLATHQSYGTGCGATATSIYNMFPTAHAAALALNLTALKWTRTGAGYLVTFHPETMEPPSANAVTLALADEAELGVPLSTPFPFANGSTSTLWVCSNAIVSMAPNGVPGRQDVGDMLNAPQTAWWSWHNYDPSIPGSGPVQFEEVAGIAYVTWNGVWDHGATSGLHASTLQFQFDLATGDVTMVFELLGTLNDTYLVGYSPGGISAGFGSTDFTELPLLLHGTDWDRLSLVAAPRPTLGATVTYTVNYIHPTALLSAHMMSLGGVDPGINLTGIGMPGCRQYVDTSIAATTLLFGSPQASRSFVVPSSLSFLGLPLDSQAASLVPGLNPLGASLSNAIASTIGFH